MSSTTIIAGVSFAKTPAAEITSKHEQILAVGWTEDDRGDPWVISYEKKVDDQRARDAERELRDIMGDYWIDADGIRALLDK